MTTQQPVIEIEDGAVVLGGRPILRGVDLTVTPGEVVAVLGANGSGKSTLVRTILGLAPTVRGQVRLFGTSLDRFRDWPRIGFVPQRVSAGTGVPATVWEVVAAGRLARRRLWRPLSRADRTAVRDAIEAVGLTARTREPVATLSGGQQQRTLIARALAGEPDLLILDEPTAGVDLPSQEAFARALADLVRRGATIVLVAHELGPLAPLVDRTIVMRDGRVAYDGPPVAPAEDHGHPSWVSDDHHHPDEQRRAADNPPLVTSPVDPPTEGEVPR